MQNQSDQQLVAEYLNGDEKSLEVLIKRYLKPIYGFAYRYVRNSQEAEDITQEVFLRVWRNLKKFDKQKSFKSWIYAIAKNASLDFLKKKKPILFSEFEETDGRNVFSDKITDTSFLPDKIAEIINTKEVLVRAMGKLSEKYRVVLSLYYDRDFSFREISEMLREPFNTVKSRHRRGLICLRKLLAEQ